jgi:hypothetical protein
VFSFEHLPALSAVWHNKAQNIRFGLVCSFSVTAFLYFVSSFYSCFAAILLNLLDLMLKTLF